ncbi:MAG TPA: hypothetical protein PK659_09085 [Methanothrix sp.]|nr:hypothetical protein [Methanothrix sp.]HOL44391.1 hypothetical protein [Methanothrix sp.]HPO89400.1 hypothetical protein [Methanothrix sp.]
MARKTARRGHSVPPVAAVNLQGKGMDGTDVVSLQDMIVRDARSFLYTTPDHTNRFAYYRLMESFDPMLQFGRNYIALLVQRSYLGPRMDTSDEDYVETPGFLDDVNGILSELQLSSIIGAIVKDLIRHGNSFVRLRRDQSGKITTAEVIPPDAVTILSEDAFRDGRRNQKVLISRRDYFVLNEQGDDKYVVHDPTRPDPKPDDDGKPPEIVIAAEDMIHFAWDAEGSQVKDSLGRDTYSVWGQSIYDSVLVYVKAKLAAIIDFVRYMRFALPRWVVNVDLSDVRDMSQYTGSADDRFRQASEAINKIMQQFYDNLYYVDTDRNSPTYRKTLPIEPDAFVFLSDGCSMEQKGGGVSVSSNVLDVIKQCDRAIASALGVPLTMFGYSEGNTYATSKVTAKFLAAYGGGLIRLIESTIKEFLRREFERRNLTAFDEDWENLYVEYDRDDVEEAQMRMDVTVKEAQAAGYLSNVVATLYGSGIITMNEARQIMSAGTKALQELTEMEGGDTLKALQPMIPATALMSPEPTRSTFRSAVEEPSDMAPSLGDQEIEERLTLDAKEPKLEELIRRAFRDALEWFADELAGRIQAGQIELRDLARAAKDVPEPPEDAAGAGKGEKDEK